MGRVGVRVDILPALCHRRDTGGGRVRDGERIDGGGDKRVRGAGGRCGCECWGMGMSEGA